MSDFSYNDMLRMQSEAKQRVLEMQKRSRSAADSWSGNKNKNTDDGSNDNDLPRVPKAVSFPAELNGGRCRQQHNVNYQHNHKVDLRNTLYSVFGNLTDDDYEKMFILSLCLLLAKDNKDDSLIFALMYLLS